MSLFESLPEQPLRSSKGPPHIVGGAPLAERMRPRSLDELVGQEHLVGPGKPLRVQIERDDASSMIFWGPPGVGKTTSGQDRRRDDRGQLRRVLRRNERHQGD